MLEQIISREDQYEVAKARAELAFTASLLISVFPLVIGLFIRRLNQIEGR